MSKIEWTEQTWNPVRGCSVVSPGCTNCYAMKTAHRMSGPGGAYEGLTKLSKGGPVWSGEVRCVPEMLDKPLRRRKPTMYFVNSMSDLFHEDVPDEFIAAVFGVMAACPQHTFQVLTKRPERAVEWFKWIQSESERYELAPPVRCAGHLAGFVPESNPRSIPLPLGWPLSSVWLGVSVEDQQRADERIPVLLQIPAAVRFLSCEPLLGPVDISPWIGTPVHVDEIGARESPDRNLKLEEAVALAGGLPMQDPWINPVGWVIVGGESGPGSRPCHIEWVRSIRDQCWEAGVACFVKQLGRYPQEVAYPEAVTESEAASWMRDGWCRVHEPNGRQHWRRYLRQLDRKGGDPSEWPEDLRVREWPEVPNAP